MRGLDEYGSLISYCHVMLYQDKNKAIGYGIFYDGIYEMI